LLGAAADDLREIGDVWGIGDAEAGAEIVPEGDAELAAGLGKTEEGVTAVASSVTFGAAADLALGDLTANVVFRTVGVQWDLRPIQHAQQFRLVGVQPLQQPVERDEAGPAAEDAVEPGA
jgi:hypothetical protein